MMKILDFLFFRWKSEIFKRGRETWSQSSQMGFHLMDYEREFVDYKLTNKFDGSIKIKRKYLN